MKPSLYLLILSSFLLGCGGQEQSSTPERIPEPDYNLSEVEYDDPEMMATIQTARETFPDFWDVVSEDLKRPSPELDAATVKAYFHDEDAPEDGEHLWVDITGYDGETISGYLVDRPKKVTSVQSGTEISFTLDQLTDWLYVLEEKAVGAYTVRLLRSRMTEQDRLKHDSYYPYKFD